MAPLRILRLSVALLALLTLGGSRAFVAPTEVLADGFDDGLLRSNVWSERRLLPGAAMLQTEHGRNGARALAITVQPGDDPLGDGSDRAELAESESVRLPAGQEVWYGFSMRIADPIPLDGNRLVVGQWHQSMPGSPFLAQRFRNGVFHITLQDGRCRIWLAWQMGAHPKKRRGCRVAVQRFADLPPSDSGWIDMVYRIRPDPNGNGLVEVWANGQRIARATGAIGYDGMRQQFFKFGPYRDPATYPMTVYLDSFRRGASFAQVDPSRLIAAQ